MYNCETQIGRVLECLSNYTENFAGILLIDNRSQDSTISRARAAIENHKLTNSTILINKTNVSLGGSHKVAFKFAIENNYDYVVVLHGDDQADFFDLIHHLKVQAHLKYDCLLGARFHPRSRLIGYSKFRIFGNRVLNICCSFVCKDRILDMGSGLNMYSKKFFSDTAYLSFPNDLTFNISLLFHSYFRNYKVLFFPITWKEEDQISNAKVFQQMRKIMWLCMRSVVNRNSVYLTNSGPGSGYDVAYKA